MKFFDQKQVDEMYIALGYDPVFFKLFGIQKSRFLTIIQEELQNEKETNRVRYNRRWWVRNTFQDLSKKADYTCERTLRRHVSSLKEIGVLLVEKIAKKDYDQTNFYTIDYKKVGVLFKKWEKEKKQKDKKALEKKLQNKIKKQNPTEVVVCTKPYDYV